MTQGEYFDFRKKPTRGAVYQRCWRQRQRIRRLLTICPLMLNSDCEPGTVPHQRPNVGDADSSAPPIDSHLPEVCLNNKSIEKTLRQWYVRNRIEVSTMNDLPNDLRPYHPTLSKDTRALMGAPRTTELNRIGAGEYCNIGLQKALLKIQTPTIDVKQRTLSVQSYIDGM